MTGAGGSSRTCFAFQPVCLVFLITLTCSVLLQIIKKTRFPHWDEVLEFDLEERELEKETRGPLLSMEVWDWDMVGKNDFLGQVSSPGSGLRMQGGEAASMLSTGLGGDEGHGREEAND